MKTRRPPRRPNGISVSETYKRWAECDRKILYPTLDSAEYAVWHHTIAQQRAYEPVIYICTQCAGYHIGRPLRAKHQKYQEAKYRRRPTEKEIQNRADEAMLIELGSRAYWVGHHESIKGGEGKRINVIMKSLIAAKERREWR